jgi:hypothetical protein
MMEELWELLVIGYWVVVGGVGLLLTIKLMIQHHIYSIDDVCSDKDECYEEVIGTLEDDLGISIKKPHIIFDYSPNDEMRGFYDPNNHSITLFLKNLDSVYDFTLTLTEEIHHSVFVNTRSGMNIYNKYDKIVGYDNNPLEYSAKQYAKEKFRLIHRILKKRGLIQYKV